MSSDLSNNTMNEELFKRLKLAALWASLMFLYIYADYFMLYTGNTIKNMMNGIMGPLGPANDKIMIGVSILMIVPSMMICLSALLPRQINKWLNILLGCAYAFIAGASNMGGAPFYVLFGVVEIVVSLLIVFIAFSWRKKIAK